MPKVGNFPTTPTPVPQIPMSMVSGVSVALANTISNAVKVVNLAMAGTIALDFSMKYAELIEANQTSSINFTATGTQFLTQKLIELTATTSAVTFDASFEELAGSRAIVPSKKNYIYFVKQSNKIGYSISQNKVDAVAEAGVTAVVDPILNVPNLVTYINPFDLDTVDVNAFTISDQSTYGARKYWQATVNLRPTLSSKKLSFGDNTRFLRPDSLIPFSNKTFSVTFVAEGSWNADRMIMGHELVINNTMRIWYRTGSIQLGQGTGHNYTFPIVEQSSNNLKVISIIGYDDAGTKKIKLRINGVDHATIITNIWGTPQFSGGSLIGNDLNATGKGYVGSMGGIVIVGSTPSNGDLLLIENQLKTENAIVY